MNIMKEAKEDVHSRKRSCTGTKAQDVHVHVHVHLPNTNTQNGHTKDVHTTCTSSRSSSSGIPQVPPFRYVPQGPRGPDSRHTPTVCSYPHSPFIPTGLR